MAGEEKEIPPPAINIFLKNSIQIYFELVPELA